MKKSQGIRKKLTRLILIITIVSVAFGSFVSIFSMKNMSDTALSIASSDAISRLSELAQSKANIADSMLQLAQNQTILVAEGAEKILSESEYYLKGYSEKNLPNISCADTEKLGKYSVHVRVPESMLKNVEKDAEGTVTFAELDYNAETGGKYTLKEELYLSSLLSNELGQIERFRNSDGTYTGFSATYFCFADSGVDVLGDLETQPMICYDARERGWYQGTLAAVQDNTLSQFGVYWTEPVQDASGRGISLICAVPVEVDGKIVGIAGSGGLLTNFADLIKSTKLGTTGFSFMVNRNTSKVIINPNTTADDKVESEVMIETDLSQSSNEALVNLAREIKTSSSGTMEKFVIDGQDVFLSYSALDNNDWTMVTVISTEDELIMKSYNELNRQNNMIYLIFSIIVAILVIAVIIIVEKYAKRFTSPIIELKQGVENISNGSLNQLLDIKSGDEIEELGNAFNSMAVNLDNYIKNLASVTAEKERIGAELSIATEIQAQMLPSIFPAFPDRPEFDIYATMTPAKEVGGDFYDFFMVDERHLAIVVADVSGKGVPAALFMVIGKTLIKDHTIPGRDLGEVFTDVNRILCESNEHGMFITAFEGVLDLVTGEFNYVNAGHETPYILRNGEKWEAYKIKPGFVLAGLDMMKYKAGTLTLQPGDKIFQYTDGVTEATDSNNELFGSERLEKVLDNNIKKEPTELLIKVKEDIDKFVGEAPQFDDITMICLEYKERME